MDQQEILKFIHTQGYRSQAEIRTQFEKENQEILAAILVALVDRHHVRKISYESTNEKSDLYYIPK